MCTEPVINGVNIYLIKVRVFFVKPREIHVNNAINRVFECVKLVKLHLQLGLGPIVVGIFYQAA